MGMTNVAAPIWNQIAATQRLATPAAKIAFRLDQNQLAIQEDIWIQLQAEANYPKAVARCLPTFLPLLAERKAIAHFVSQHPNYRNALPEVNDAREAVALATMDTRLTPSEQKLLEKALTAVRPLSEWKVAATAAARH